MQHRISKDARVRLQMLAFAAKRLPYLSEFAEITRIPKITCYKWAQEGRMPAQKDRGRWIVGREVLDDWQPQKVQPLSHKLDALKAREIRALAAEGETGSSLAQRYEVSESTISRVIQNKVYSE